MIATDAICSAQTGAASTTFFGFLPGDPVVGDFGLSQFIAEVPVSSEAYQGFFFEFFFLCFVYQQCVPGVIQDVL